MDIKFFAEFDIQKWIGEAGTYGEAKYPYVGEIEPYVHYFVTGRTHKLTKNKIKKIEHEIGSMEADYSVTPKDGSGETHLYWVKQIWYEEQ